MKQGELFPRLPRDEARAWLSRALIAANPADAARDLKALEEYGDSLFSIAERFAIPDHALIWWVQDQPKGKDWSLTAWRAHCEKYAAAAALLPPEATAPPGREREIEFCLRCYANVVERIDKRWWCPKCGEVRQ
jgi:hypothetical protein